MDEILTFPRQSESGKARGWLDRLGLSYGVVSPYPAYGRVGVESLVLAAETRAKFFEASGADVVCSGWVEYRPAKVAVAAAPPRDFAEDILGTCAIMVLAPCVADLTKIRLFAHIGGKLGEVLPYLNAEMPQAMYCREAETLTYMDGPRLISLYAQRITVAKADELVEAWDVLEKIRCRVNETWGRRKLIEPCWEMRKKPPALEIYKRLPGTNCRECGEKTCMAFALRLWNGEVRPSRCTPVWEGEYGRLKGALVEICASLGVSERPGRVEGET